MSEMPGICPHEKGRGLTGGNLRRLSSTYRRILGFGIIVFLFFFFFTGHCCFVLFCLFLGEVSSLVDGKGGAQLSGIPLTPLFWRVISPRFLRSTERTHLNSDHLNRCGRVVVIWCGVVWCGVVFVFPGWRGASTACLFSAAC